MSHLLLLFTLWTGDYVCITTICTDNLFLAVLLTNESVALIAFHRRWRIFLLPAYEAAPPFLQWPTSDAISIIFYGKWTIFFKKCGNISRQWRYLRSWDEILFHQTQRQVFQEKYFALRFIRWCVDGVYHSRIDACNVHMDIKHSKRPSPCETRDRIRSTHLVTCPRHPLSYYSPG